MSLEKCESLNLTPVAKIIGYADAAQDPKWFTTSPAKAVPIVLNKSKLNIDDIDLFEFNEAFRIFSSIHENIEYR